MQTTGFQPPTICFVIADTWVNFTENDDKTSMWQSDSLIDVILTHVCRLTLAFCTGVSIGYVFFSVHQMEIRWNESNRLLWEGFSISNIKNSEQKPIPEPQEI